MRVFLALFSVLAVFILLVGGGALWYASGQLRAGQEAHEAAVADAFARHHAAFVEDQHLFRDLALFPEPSGTADAGPFFNPRLPWEGQREVLERWQATHPEDVTSLAIEGDVDDALTGNDWLEAAPAHWRDADAGWMADLSGYAHWDLELTGPATMMDDEDYDWVMAPLPMHRPLMFWAKIRLLQGLQDGDVLDAAQEVRHLARLSYSTETLIGAVVAVEIVRFERQAFEHAVSNGRSLPEGWAPPTGETLDRIRRALWAANAYRSIDTPPAHRDQTLYVGRCTAMTESGWAALMLRPFLVRDHREAYDWLGRTLDASDCRLTRLRRAWVMPEDQPIATLRTEDCEAGDPTCSFEGLMWIPAVRRYVGDTLRSIAGPNWFQQYER